MVVVDGPPGSGRTFVLEQAYRVFVAGSDGAGQRYWPSELTPGVLVPDGFVPQGESRLDRLWLAVEGDETAGHALHQLADQLDAHAGVLRRTLAARRQGVRQLGYCAAQAAGLTVAGVGLLTPGMQAIAVAAALYGLALGVDATVRAGAQSMGSGSVEEAKRIHAGWAVNPREAAELKAGVEALSEGLSLVSREVPVLLIIDGAETLDEHTEELVRAILAGDGNITVVVAVDLGAATGTWGTWLRGTALDQPDRCRVVTLGSLPDPDMAALAVTLLPDLPEGSTSGLVRLLEVANGLPGILVDYLSMPVVREALVAGRPLPDDLTGFTEDACDDQRHAQLSSLNRDTLELLACLGTSTCAEWVAPLGLNGDRLLEAKGTGRIEVEADGLVRFTSQRAFQTALRAYRRHHTDEQARAVIADYGRVVELAQTSDTWTAAPGRAREAALAALTARLGDAADPVWLAELLDLRRRNGTVRDLHDVVLQAALTRLTTAGVGTARLFRAAADTLTAVGHRDRAVALYQEELDRVTARRGPTDGARIPALEALAYVNAATGHDLLGRPEASPFLTAAASQFREILTLREARLRHLQAKGDPIWAELKAKTIEVRWNLAETLVDLRKFRGPDGALHHGQTTIDELRELGRAFHHRTLQRRHNLAGWTGQAGEPAKARDLFADLVPDVARVLGADHPTTLITRGNLAHWTGQAGERSKARDLFADLVPDLVRVLGADHPATLTARNNLARWTGEAGEPARARDLVAALVPDLVRVLGADHPHTLTARNNLKYWTDAA